MEINAKGKENEKFKGPDFQQPSTATQIPPVEGRVWSAINGGINTELRQQGGRGELKQSREAELKLGLEG